MTRELKIEYVECDALRSNERNARTHSKKQLKQLAGSIKKLGFNCPIIARQDGTILAGHGRVEAARLAGLTTLPVIRLDHLDDVQARAFMLADNKIAQSAGWNFELLAAELSDLIELDFEMDATGFSATEIDLAIGAADEGKPKGRSRDDIDDVIPKLPTQPVTERGDLWILGRHKLVCGDARLPRDYNLLLASEVVDMMFTDPPYNVPIAGHVSGLGKVKHQDFAMACGELSNEAFVTFLVEALRPTSKCCKDGAIAFVCMDWRHMGELLTAGQQVFSELKNVCVWVKKNGGMGTFYRSRHEMVFAYKVGTAQHTNNFGLGDTGRYRTNVWEYAGISSMSATRAEELALHPTVKPVALVEDALKDCSNRGQLVLDPFGGSGTTLVAAERCGRSARLIEYDPGYCDVIIARYERVTGKQAILDGTGQTFEEVAELRISNLGEAA